MSAETSYVPSVADIGGSRLTVLKVMKDVLRTCG